MILLAHGAQFDKTVHDFGRISERDGMQSCSFTLSNTGSEDICILAVTATCGCTQVKWTKGMIHPGETGTVDVTYANDEGAYPFDKTLNVYISGEKKPVVLHIRGVVTKK